MKQLLLAATSLVFLASCATRLASDPPPGLPAQISAPEIQVGDSWRYAVSDGFTRLSRGTVEYRVRAIEGDTVTVDVIANDRHHTELFTRDGSWLRRPATNLQEFAYNPPYRAFDFPLAAGKEWSARTIATDPADGRSFPVGIRGRVLGWERVRVPAGEFDALKVHRRVYFEYWVPVYRGQSVIDETDWYAPSVGQVVKSETNSKFLRFAGIRPPGFVRVSDGDHSNDDVMPRYEQDEWLVYELLGPGER